MTVKNCLLIEKLNFKGGKKNVVNPKERLLWSIALPGFGQFLNKKYCFCFFRVLGECPGKF
jgi:hypothetical protein